MGKSIYHKFSASWERIVFHFKNQGFTMLEVIIVVGIVSAISMVLADISISHSRLYGAESDKNDLQLQGVRVMNTMGKMIKLADQVVAAKTINSKSYTTSSQTIILKLPAVDSQGKVINDKYDYAVFYLDSQDENKCVLSLEPDPSSSRALIDKLLSEFCDGLKFVYDSENYENADSVFVDLTLSKSAFNKSQSFSLNRKINLRNKKI